MKTGSLTIAMAATAGLSALWSAAPALVVIVCVVFGLAAIASWQQEGNAETTQASMNDYFAFRQMSAEELAGAIYGIRHTTSIPAAPDEIPPDGQR